MSGGVGISTDMQMYITHHTLTFDELGLKGRGIATEVNMGTLLQDERVFLVKRVTT